jgi:catechol-2,3-dioxygenase
MGSDPNTPAWVQHIAFKVKDVPALLEAKARLEARGIDVLGPTNHEIFQSIYFFDPNGHRIELAADTAAPGALERLHAIAPAMIEAWSRTRQVVRHAAWLHEKELGAQGSET